MKPRTETIMTNVSAESLLRPAISIAYSTVDQSSLLGSFGHHTPYLRIIAKPVALNPNRISTYILPKRRPVLTK